MSAHGVDSLADKWWQGRGGGKNFEKFADIICEYVVIGCFEWKIGIIQQTVVRVYYILKYP